MHDHDHGSEEEHSHHGIDESELFHLDIHRAIDELGKYAIEIDLSSDKGIPKDKIKCLIEQSMRESTENCMLNGADMVGHTKSILMCKNGNIMSSLVDTNLPIEIKDNVEGDMI
ncbi:MAG: hypothetical protein LBJ20_06980 [Candidatus Methanoplasma sp.]|nr:hypothetical protein [Candidatus Methanoplasma sp.]